MNTRLLYVSFGLFLALIPTQDKPAIAAPIGMASTASTSRVDAAQRKLDNARALQAQFPGKLSELAVDEALQQFNAAIAPSSTSRVQPSGAPITRDESEPNNSPSSPNLVNLKWRYAQVNGAIGTAGDVDYFYFIAPAGARIWILVDSGGTQDPGANRRDTEIELLAEDGATLIESDDDDGTGNGGDATEETGQSSVIAGRLLPASVSGGYYVRVHGFDGSYIISPYRLFIALSTDEQVSEVESNNSAGLADPIQAPIGTRSGTLSSGDVDYFRFFANFGDTAFVALDADPERDGSTFNAVLELRDGSGSLITTIDSSTLGSVLNPTAEAFRFNITTGGNYYVTVKGFDGTDVGNYRLMVAISPAADIRAEAESNNTPGGADYLEVAGNYAEGTGSITAGDVDYWIFNLPTSSFVWISTDVSQIGLVSSDTKIDLLASDGVTVIESDDDDGSCNDRGGTVFSTSCSAITGTLLAAGTYYVRVQGYQTTTVINRYRLNLARTIIAATVEAESNDSISFANVLTGTIGMRIGDISPAGDADYFRINAKGGDVIYFAADGSFGANIDLTLELQNSSGTVLLSIDGSGITPGTRVGESAQYAIPLNERSTYAYYVVVRNFTTTTTGSYKLMGYVLPGGDRIFGSGFE